MCVLCTYRVEENIARPGMTDRWQCTRHFNSILSSIRQANRAKKAIERNRKAIENRIRYFQKEEEKIWRDLEEVRRQVGHISYHRHRDLWYIDVISMTYRITYCYFGYLFMPLTIILVDLWKVLMWGSYDWSTGLIEWSQVTLRRDALAQSKRSWRTAQSNRSKHGAVQSVKPFDMFSYAKC